MQKKTLNLSSWLIPTGLFGAGVLMAWLVGVFQFSPGYMDADYYYHVGFQLARGKGINQEILWNYLDFPSQVFSPACTYWMPLAGILAAIGMVITGSQDFSSGKILFIVATGIVPVITFLLTKNISGDIRKSLLSAGLALVSGFYFPYLSTTDTFPLYMVLGGIYFFLAKVVLEDKFQGNRLFGLLFLWGVITGLMHLARVEGLIWFVGTFITWLARINSFRYTTERTGWFRLLVLGAMSITIGYLMVTGFWYARNWATWASIFPPGNSRTLWITEYEEIFIFPASLISISNWWEAGVWHNLYNRAAALWANLQTIIAVQGEIILVPLIVAGWYKMRRKSWMILAGILWAATYLLMSLLFPFAGINGGYFHSSAAFQPLLWGLSSLGMSDLVDKLIRWRRWEKVSQVRRFFWGLAYLVCLLISLNAYGQKMSGGEFSGWNQSGEHYRQVEEVLSKIDPAHRQVVMVNNPPGYYGSAERPAIVIPFGDVEMLLSAGKMYQAKFLVLENRNPNYLRPVYDDPGNARGLRYLGDVDSTRLFQILD